MSRLILLALFGSLLGATPALADCSLSKAPAVPDGRAATAEQMAAAQEAVQRYSADVENYLVCLEAEEKRAADTDTDEARTARAARWNAAVDTLKATADAFNAELRLFKATAR